MNQLVRLVKNDVFTDSMVIAEGTGNEHNSVTRIIRNYTEDFEEFGKIEFMDLKSKNPQGGRPIKIYLLNEQQATLLMTYLGNSEMVRKFKKELVHQFYAMRQYILERQTPHWQATRIESKSNRRMETDEIKQLVQYAIDNGSKNAKRYYCNLTKLANKAVGIESDSRNLATTNQLNNLILIEHIIGEVIKLGIQQELYYKDIYKACKKRIEQFREVAYLTAA